MKWCLIAVVFAVLAGCAKPSRYEWGSYEESLYRYYKDPAATATYTEAVAKAARTGDATGRTAPGVHAEYGQMLIVAGKKAEAVQEFENEKKYWPESTYFMDRMIREVIGGALRSTADQSAPTSLTVAGKVGS